MKSKPAIFALSFSLLATFPRLPLASPDWYFPPNSGVIDVVTDSGVDNTGKIDVTKRLNQILANTINVSNKGPAGRRIRRLIIKNPGQHVWARGYNGEGTWEFPADTSDIAVAAGTLFVAGYKTENKWVKASCTGGSLEMFGCFIYRGSSPDLPLFRVTGDGQFSVAQMIQVSHAEPLWTNLVSETHNGQTRVLTNTANNSFDISLYSGYTRPSRSFQKPEKAATKSSER
jgi:hypothetical protein